MKLSYGIVFFVASCLRAYSAECLLERFFSLDNRINQAYFVEYDIFKHLERYSSPSRMRYVAVPWGKIIMGAVKKHRIRRMRSWTGPTCTTCFHFQFEDLIPLMKSKGFTILFTPHARLKDKHRTDIRIIPIPHVCENSVDPAEHKDIWYSFVGATNTHPLREIICGINHPDTAVIQERTGQWHFYLSKDEKEQREHEYKDVLARSRFSLCPPGKGAGTMRFWESLKAGAIPVIFDDVWLPEGFDWKSCCLFLQPDDIYRIPEILAAVSPEQEYQMREAALSAFRVMHNQNYYDAYYRVFESFNY